MHSHQASCLRGPVSRNRGVWPPIRKAKSTRKVAKPPSIDAAQEIPRLTDPDIRADLVQRIRREIAAGTYDTPEKFEAALQRFLERLE
jgi:hypothetical protein